MVAAAGFAAWGIAQWRGLGVNQGYEPEQPVAFSHKIHAGDNGIACLYCHFGAETSRHAGIPPTALCLNCHTKIKADSPEIRKIREALEQNKPIEWLKVHELPDFAYFNHSRHVTAGVACQSCHGPVETMGRMRQFESLSMGWCIQCHRQQGVQVPPGHGAAKSQKQVESLLDCAKCHY